MLLLSALTMLNRARAIVGEAKANPKRSAMSPVFGIPANVVYATAGIYAVLVLASLVVLRHALAQSGRALCRTRRAHRVPGGG